MPCHEFSRSSCLFVCIYMYGLAGLSDQARRSGSVRQVFWYGMMTIGLASQLASLCLDDSDAGRPVGRSRDGRTDGRVGGWV